ncbi:MAG TPA: hypothetical protein VLW55_27590 [Burkholderiaceae bacterium]|nr:hypothetical protein [Burkholderiaceae bacterium]
MSSFAAAVRDRLRTLLNIRKPRTTQRRGPRPSVGARIYWDDVRMTVQAGMTIELWGWLQTQGWREVLFKGDRRRYRDISTDWAMQLIDCPSERREEVLAQAIENAVARTGSTEGGVTSARTTTPGSTPPADG